MSKAKKSKRFKYQLETLLKYRELKENQEKELFLKKERLWLEEIKKKEALLKKEDDAIKEYRLFISSMVGIDMSLIQIRKHHLKKLKEDLQKQEDICETAKKEVEEQRKKLNQALKEKKIIEKDKAKTREKWFNIMKKEDNKFMDEISSIGFVKKNTRND